MSPTTDNINIISNLLLYVSFVADFVTISLTKIYIGLHKGQETGQVYILNSKNTTGNQKLANTLSIETVVLIKWFCGYIQCVINIYLFY